MRIILAFFMCLLSGMLFAQALTGVKYLDALTSTPSSFTITEQFFTDIAGGVPITYSDVSVANYVKFAIDPGKDSYISSDKTYTINVTIQYWTYSGGTFSSTTMTPFDLEVTYDYDNSASFNDSHIYTFTGAYKLKVTVNSVKIDGTVTTTYSSLPNSLYIESYISPDRHYDFDPNDIADAMTVTSTADGYIKINNFAIAGAEAYDIEWTYANDYSETNLATALTDAEVKYCFHNNASRIRVYNTAPVYLPATFDRGYVIVRVRGIGKTGTHKDKDWYGKWNLVDHYDSGESEKRTIEDIDVALFTPYILLAACEKDKSWMYQVTFAEEGKMKHVINYYDGTSRSRQVITVLNTENEAIIGETFYDHQGRGVAQSLPEPALRTTPTTPNKQMTYVNNFHESSEYTGQKFGKDDFDKDASGDACEPDIYPFKVSDALDNYYSIYNPIQTWNNAFIPDGGGYTYMLVEYMPDNTGRVKRQAGVGATFSLTSGHATSYFYGKPFQEELDRLFGTNVGDASHYQKNMVIDPNGQVSVSYLDMKGNVIATALAGDTTENLKALTLEGSETTQYANSNTSETIDLLDINVPIEPHGSSNGLTDDGMGYYLSTPILVTAQSDYQFAYTAEEIRYLQECLDDVCIECVYDLDITLTDLCPEESFEATAVNYHAQIGDMPSVVTGLETPESCTTSTYTALTTSLFQDNLPVGSYYVNKTLKINSEALNIYTDLYMEAMESSECFISFSTFLEDAISDVNVADCDYDCDECALLQSGEDPLGTFIATYATSEEPSTEEITILTNLYNQIVSSCEDMCNTPGNDFCLSGYQMLVADVSPGSTQYGEYFNPAIGTVDPTIYPLSVYNDDNVLQDRDMIVGYAAHPNWRYPVKYIDGNWEKGYYNEDGTTRSMIVLTIVDGGYSPAYGGPTEIIDDVIYGYPENLVYLENFLELYQASWAKSLIAYHPEYYYYEECAQHYTQTEDFEVDVTDPKSCLDCNTYQFDEFILSLSRDEAMDLDFDQIEEYDPFFATYPNVYTDATATEFRDLYIDEFEPSCGLAMHEVAWLNVHATPILFDATCTDLQDAIDADGAVTGSGFWQVIETDEEWEQFALLYASSKYDYWVPIAGLYADENKAYNGCIGEDYAYQLTSVGPIFDIGTWWDAPSESYVCGLAQGIYLSDKIRRFGNTDVFYDAEAATPEEIAEELLDESDMYYYIATGEGNLPKSFDIELFLNGLVEAHPSTWYTETTFPVTDVLSLTPRLWEELSDLSMDDWNPSVPTATSNIKWGSGGGCAYSHRLILNYNASAAWSSILGFHGIDMNAATGEFTIIAELPSGVTETISGTTCFTVDDMSFYTTDCELTPEAVAVFTVMSTMTEDETAFDATSFSSIDNVVAGLSAIVQPMLNSYLGDGIPFQWKRSGDNYVLADNTGNRYITILIPGGIDEVPIYFNDFTPSADPAYSGIINDFILTANYPSDPPVPYAGSIVWTWGDIEDAHFSVANCNVSDDIYCVGQEYINMDDFETFIKEIVDEEKLKPASEFNLDDPGFLPYSDNLETITGNPLADDKWYYNVAASTDDHLFATISHTLSTITSSCTIEMKIEDPAVDASLTDGSIASITSVVGDFTYATDDYTYDFIATGVTIADIPVTIEGNTGGCIKLKNCGPCQSEPGETRDIFSPAVVVTTYTDGATGTVSGSVTTSGLGTETATFDISESYLSAKAIGTDGARNFGAVQLSPNQTKRFLALARFSSDIITDAYVDSGLTYTMTLELGEGSGAIEESTDPCDPPVYEPFEAISHINDCVDQQVILAYSNALEAYNNYIIQLIDDFQSEYIANCLQSLETFTMNYMASEYHYTLYYYDQANNLVMTVPPKGVQLISSDSYDDIDNYRNFPDTYLPVPGSHTLTTRYIYNSLNQLKWQSTPDAGVSRFWYDALGRLAVSQNAQQNDGTSAASTTDPQYFSYTAYDNLGRIAEVGELQTDEFSDANIASAITSSNVPGTWADSKRQITKTQYDAPLLTGGASPFGTDGQNYLRFRVADVTIDENGDGTYEYATHYSYDIHGNVNNLIQDNPTLAGKGEQFKKLKYEYDLISGNVKMVSYQQGDHDEFYHKYYYDADNRILEAWTSRDNYIWERDARYTYYRHGPLARVEVGDLIVQGTDYAYTLQGWMKGVNAGGLVVSKDMGLDGKGGASHKAVATDAFGFIIDYYTGDYTQISTTANSFIPNVSSAGGYSYVTPDLYNGNIRAMSTSLMKPTVTSGKHDIANVLGKAYQYDQLNRIYESWSYEKSMNTSGTFTWVNSGAGSDHSTPKWNTAYTYDANGNILTMKRAGDLATLPSNTYDMDQFTYTYYADCNQLRYVNDTQADGTYSVDVDNQESVTGVDNTTTDGDPVNDVYSYDKIGNLIRDDAEDISNITWNVYGKITKIEYNTTSTRGDIEFAYDPMGNRIMKKVTPKVTTDETVYTYYTRDAQGNVMATYTRKVKSGAEAYDNIFISEQHIYGSSRLGYVTSNKNMEDAYSTSAFYKRTLGDKQYELSNHLGNVLVVITDRRLAQEGSGASAGKIVGFEPDVVTAQDYDPFGMLLSGRSWEVGSGYRYGFNGKESDPELYEDGNIYDYGFRIYNSRLGKFLSTDPLFKNFPWYTPYQFAGDKPIACLDLDGLEDVYYNGILINDLSMVPALDVFNSTEIGKLYLSKFIDKSINSSVSLFVYEDNRLDIEGGNTTFIPYADLLNFSNNQNDNKQGFADRYMNGDIAAVELFVSSGALQDAVTSGNSVEFMVLNTKTDNGLTSDDYSTPVEGDFQFTNNLFRKTIAFAHEFIAHVAYSAIGEMKLPEDDGNRGDKEHNRYQSPDKENPTINNSGGSSISNWAVWKYLKYNSDNFKVIKQTKTEVEKRQNK